MTKKLFANRTVSTLFMGTAVLMLLALMLPIFATAQEGELPPRGGDPPTATPVPETPTATATPIPVTGPSGEAPQNGGRLQLHVHYGPNWQWHLTAWQELWTEVQWSDGTNWFVVEGWRGQMDTISQVGGQWVSLREWWVGGEDLGTGPFRWVVYERPGGNVLLTSAPFTLPARGGETMVINVTVGE